MTVLDAPVADRRRALITLAVCCTAIFMTTLDNTILNVALPSLGRQLRASGGQLEWSVDSYITCRAGLLFVAASISDRFGRRRAMIAGTLVFTVSSAACGLSGNAAELIACRVVQAAGGALMTPASMGILVNTFTGRLERARALGVWSAATGLSTTMAPLIGGFLVETYGWRAVFFVNVPVGALSLAGTAWLSPSRPAIRQRGPSVVGQLSIALALTALVYGLIQAPQAGWSSPAVLVALVISAGSATLFFHLERHGAHPLIGEVEGSWRAIPGSVGVAIVAYLAMNGFMFFNSLYLQQLRGISPFTAGLLITPVTVGTIMLAPLSGQVTGQRGSRLPAVISCSLIAAAMTLLAIVIAPHTPIPLLLSGYLLLGIGMGLVNPPLADALVRSMSPGAASVAAATTSTARQVGTSLGIALMGSVVYGVAPQAASGSIPEGQTADAFTAGISYAYGLAGLLAVFGVTLAWWSFRGGGPRATPDPKMAEPELTE